MEFETEVRKLGNEYHTFGVPKESENYSTDIDFLIKYNGGKELIKRSQPSLEGILGPKAPSRNSNQNYSFVPEVKNNYENNEEYLPNVRFVINYIDVDRRLQGFTSFNKGDETIYIPKTPDSTNIAYNGGNYWSTITHEQGHNSPQRPYQTTPQKEESDLRSCRGE